MKVGFTGTRQGMVAKQWNVCRAVIKRMENIEEFHHGDCRGSDQQAHELVKQLHPDTKIFIHPPINEKFRAFCKGSFEAPKKDFLMRDKDIVDAIDLLIATPKQEYEALRSGTWTTIRYARKSKKETVVIYPSGFIVRKEESKENNDGGTAEA